MVYKIPKNSAEVLVNRLLDGWSEQDIINHIMGYDPRTAKFPQPKISDLYEYLYDHQPEKTSFSDWELSDFIENCRYMWIAISILTERNSRIIKKKEVISLMGIYPYWLESKCFLCQYIVETYGYGRLLCDYCPVDWKADTDEEIPDCLSHGSSYFNWYIESNFTLAAKYAKEIAELPLKEEYKKEE